MQGSILEKKIILFHTKNKKFVVISYPFSPKHKRNQRKNKISTRYLSLRMYELNNLAILDVANGGPLAAVGANNCSGESPWLHCLASCTLIL